MGLIYQSRVGTCADLSADITGPKDACVIKDNPVQCQSNQPALINAAAEIDRHQHVPAL